MYNIARKTTRTLSSEGRRKIFRNLAFKKLRSEMKINQFVEVVTTCNFYKDKKIKASKIYDQKDRGDIKVDTQWTAYIYRGLKNTTVKEIGHCMLDRIYNSSGPD